MARVRPKAETNFQHYRVKHLVQYNIHLTPFIRNNNTHTSYRGRGLNVNGEKLAVKHTLKLYIAHTGLIG